MTRLINIPGSDSSDYYFDIASGNTPSATLVNKFGINYAIGTCHLLLEVTREY